MKSRCENPNDPQFENYGGRGINVCAEWAASFPDFLRDMGARGINTTLDRIDVNEGYSLRNCRWAGPEMQARNKRNNRMVLFEGATMCLKELSILSGVPYQRLHERIVRRGWSVSDAVIKPPRGFRQ